MCSSINPPRASIFDAILAYFPARFGLFYKQFILHQDEFGPQRFVIQKSILLAIFYLKK
ncbi:hypothetical protein [Aquirufa nivalisilvae]|uniref:hypothetical protein n=1 Tax=Aquirufa nivalisilvae TaxID=2516557 RepID=UPI0013757088|nr:hypothetical protein [Aquirufa nivalisilvae]